MTSFLKTLFLRLCASLRPYAVTASTHVRLQCALVSQWLLEGLEAARRWTRRTILKHYSAWVVFVIVGTLVAMVVDILKTVASAVARTIRSGDPIASMRFLRYSVWEQYRDSAADQD